MAGRQTDRVSGTAILTRLRREGGPTSFGVDTRKENTHAHNEKENRLQEIKAKKDMKDKTTTPREARDSGGHTTRETERERIKGKK